MFRFSRRTLTALAAVATLVLLPVHASAAAAPAGADGARGHYIVTLTPGADLPTALQRHALAPSHTYHHVLNGFAAPLSGPHLAALRNDPNVIRIEPDGVMRALATQLNPPSWVLTGSTSAICR